MADEQADDLPKGIKLTSLDPAFLQNPYPALKRLRERAPVLHDDEFDRWYCTRFDGVREVLRDKDMSVDPRRANSRDSYSARVMLANGPDNQKRILSSVMFTDDPEHRRLRSFVSKPFAPKAIDKWHDRIREFARALLEEIREPEFDLVSRFAEPLTATVIAEMIGVAPDDRDAFKSWSDVAIATFYNPFSASKKALAATEAQNNLQAYFFGLIEARRAAPADDLVTPMLAENDNGDRLTDAEIVKQCCLLVLAGRITTTDAISNGVRALLGHQAELAKLRAHPQLIGNAVEEMLRYDTPTLSAYRIAQSEITVGGCPFQPGDVVTLSLAAANHDPAANPDPDRFDIDRKNVQHQSFGGGKHMCLGAHLARVELREGISELLSRFSELRPSARGFRHRRIPGLRGLAEYWVTAQPSSARTEGT